MNRRDFLKLLGLAGGAAVVGAGHEQHDGDEIKPHEWTPPEEGFENGSHTHTTVREWTTASAYACSETPAEYMRRKGNLSLAQFAPNEWVWVIDPE